MALGFDLVSTEPLVSEVTSLHRSAHLWHGYIRVGGQTESCWDTRTMHLIGLAHFIENMADTQHKIFVGKHAVRFQRTAASESDASFSLHPVSNPFTADFALPAVGGKSKCKFFDSLGFRTASKASYLMHCCSKFGLVSALVTARETCLSTSFPSPCGAHLGHCPKNDFQIPSAPLTR